MATKSTYTARSAWTNPFESAWSQPRRFRDA